ncbi:hypothetical protein [Dendronalium sp. ChiSLP03b]|nr:hypothetical protein [Dendronalium sp. ChiSLP03b]MDZ8207286.1 hypothetical protein [Dendronalium sp. ChiSLP03b]
MRFPLVALWFQTLGQLERVIAFEKFASFNAPMIPICIMGLFLVLV